MNDNGDTNYSLIELLLLRLWLWFGIKWFWKYLERHSSDGA